jgi:hypothetical protein
MTATKIDGKTVSASDLVVVIGRNSLAEEIAVASIKNQFRALANTGKGARGLHKSLVISP